MKNFGIRILLSSLFVLALSGASFADSALPVGLYRGMVSDLPMPRTSPAYCAADNVTVELIAGDNNVTQLRWQEEGRTVGNGMYCVTRLDADLTPTKANEWNVRFYWANDLIFAKAKLVKDRLQITAQFSGGSMTTFETNFVFGKDAKDLRYSRDIRPSFGSLQRASGTLFRN